MIKKDFYARLAIAFHIDYMMIQNCYYIDGVFYVKLYLAGDAYYRICNRYY
jgi:hypothetical protein